jgi:hypothetical protein
MSRQSHPDFLIKLILRARQVESLQENRSEQGYIMLLTTVISIVMFSLLGAYLMMTDMSKTASGSYIDSSNTFTVAESEMNIRANQVRNRFAGFGRPNGTMPAGFPTNTPISPLNRKPTSAEILAAMQKCIGGNDSEKGSEDFVCRKDDNNKSKWKSFKITGDNTTEEEKTSNYIAYSFVADKTNYDKNTQAPQIQLMKDPVYGGLFAQTYKYTVYASAIDNNSQNQSNKTNTNTVLQLDFQSEVIPLFQFAAFYEGDLEMSSSSNMTVSGWVHTNGNFYSQPYTKDSTISTNIESNLTAAGRIYNRLDANGSGCGNTSSSTSCAGITRFLKINNPGPYNNFPSITGEDPLTLAQITPLERVKDGDDNNPEKVEPLTPPPSGFLRKRNYYYSSSKQEITGSSQEEIDARQKEAIGEYWAKADMRLEMVPDRGGIDTAPDERIIPFKFTSIQTGGTRACTTTMATSGSGEAKKILDPADNYIAPDRKNAAALKCNEFSKGQLQSLRQPVMVLTNIVQTDTAMKTAENTTLGKPTLPTLPTDLQSLKTTASVDTQKKVLRALQVAIASTPTPIVYDSLSKPFSDSVVYGTNPYPNIEDSQTFKVEFERLIASISELSATERNALMAASPNQIAALQDAWFLPAPVQRVRNKQNTDLANNPSKSGFYDGRERRWMTLLQTNIKSLAVWNRDGLYVDAVDEVMTTAYSTDNTKKDAAFNSGSGANFTNGLAYTRLTDATAMAAKPAGSLQRLGLGAADTTEGGLVFHATVSEDLNEVNPIDPEITPDTDKPIYKRKADNSIATKPSADNPTTQVPIIMDYARKYKGSINTTGGTHKAYSPNGYYGESKYGFAFTDSNYLPGALSLVSDQAVYLQGDFNNHGAAKNSSGVSNAHADRLPASVVADTISILSNQCVAYKSEYNQRNHLQVPASQLNCGIPRAITGSLDLPPIVTDLAKVKSTDTLYNGYYISSNSNYNSSNIVKDTNSPTYYSSDQAIVVNAAFLSYAGTSCGNLGVNRSCPTPTDKHFSGGINNYMRMLEDWQGASGKFMNYNGSFVSLGIPLESSGKYYAGTDKVAATTFSVPIYYNVPQRNFSFDPNFNQADKLPPLTPRALYLRQQAFSRTYNN